MAFRCWRKFKVRWNPRGQRVSPRLERKLIRKEPVLTVREEARFYPLLFFDHTPPDSARESGMNSLSWRTIRFVPRRSFHHSHALPAAIRKTSATKQRA